jgi:hypothetical protein
MSVKRILLTFLVLAMTMQSACLPAICCAPLKQMVHCAAVVKKCCAIKPMPCCQVRQGNCNTRQQPQEDRLGSSDQLLAQLSASDFVLREEVLDVSAQELMRETTSTRIAIKTEKWKPDKLYILNRALLM